MKCEEFRESILEGLAGELPAETQRSFAEHESSCPACRAELARWREIETALRAGWPAEEPPPFPALSLPRPPMAWWEAGWRWFSMASAGLVAASLLALVILRPSVQWSGSSLGVSFRGAPVLSEAVGQVTKEQVQAWVRAEVQQAVAGQQAGPAASGPAQRTSLMGPEAQQWGLVRSKLELLDQSQAYLWSQVQEQQANLQSLWRAASLQVKTPPQDPPGGE